MTIEQRSQAIELGGIIGGEIGGKNPNNGFHTGEAGRAGVLSQISSGTHINQRGLSGFQTGSAVTIQLLSGTHISQLGKSGFQTKSTCPHCGKIGMTANMKRYHYDNCKKK